MEEISGGRQGFGEVKEEIPAPRELYHGIINKLINEKIYLLNELKWSFDILLILWGLYN